MNVLNLSDYKVVLAERICYDKFENDIMLIYNNFSDSAIISIIELIKTDIKEIESKGVVFDFRLLNICCTMYLGLAWSMYRKGKIIFNEEKLGDDLYKKVYDKNSIKEEIIMLLFEKDEYLQTIDDIAIRYFTLYLSRHTKDIMNRMSITFHPDIRHEESLKNIFIEKLRKFAVKVLATGVLDEYLKIE